MRLTFKEGRVIHRGPFVYQSEASRVDLTNVRCLRRRTTLVLWNCGGLMTADGELDIKCQCLRRYIFQGEHLQTVLHAIATAGCSTRRLCREPLGGMDDCCSSEGHPYFFEK